jgi:hypothetical protein
MATAVNNNNTTGPNEMDEEQLLDYEEEETMEGGPEAAKGTDGATNGDAKKAKVG